MVSICLRSLFRSSGNFPLQKVVEPDSFHSLNINVIISTTHTFDYTSDIYDFLSFVSRLIDVKPR